MTAPTPPEGPTKGDFMVTLSLLAFTGLCIVIAYATGSMPS